MRNLNWTKCCRFSSTCLDSVASSAHIIRYRFSLFLFSRPTVRRVDEAQKMMVEIQQGNVSRRKKIGNRKTCFTFLIKNLRLPGMWSAKGPVSLSKLKAKKKLEPNSVDSANIHYLEVYSHVKPVELYSIFCQPATRFSSSFCTRCTLCTTFSVSHIGWLSICVRILTLWRCENKTKKQK